MSAGVTAPIHSVRRSRYTDGTRRMDEEHAVACRLLHTLEQPDEDPYADPDVKDVLGKLPRFFCTAQDPLLPLKPSEAVKCLQREEPCWKPAGPTGTD